MLLSSINRPSRSCAIEILYTIFNHPRSHLAGFQLLVSVDVFSILLIVFQRGILQCWVCVSSTKQWIAQYGRRCFKFRLRNLAYKP